MLVEKNEHVKPESERKQGARAEAKPTAAPSGAARSALVNNANIPGTFRETLDAETGEIKSFLIGERTREAKEKFDFAASRLERFILQEASRNILKEHQREKTWQDGTQGYLYEYRVCNCTRVAADHPGKKDKGISITKTTATIHADGNPFRFVGLQTCASVWHCPICSAQISEYRAQEIERGVNEWVDSGNSVVMVTYTYPHQRTDELQENMDRFDSAWRSMIDDDRRFAKITRKSPDFLTPTGKARKNMPEFFGFVGRIRALEVTHGSNGWHQHVHELWFVQKGFMRTAAQRLALKTELHHVWRSNCVAAGLEAPSFKHGVTVEGGMSAAQYVAKFGVDRHWSQGREMAKSHSKKGKKNSSTPWDLLRRAADGDKLAGKLFHQYAVAFHGKHQLQPTPGIKALLHLFEKTDEEVAQGDENANIEILKFTDDDWRKVPKHRARGLVLELCKSGGYEAVRFYLANLK